MSLVDNNRKKAMDLIDNPYWNRYFINLKLEPTKDHEKGNLSLKRKKNWIDKIHHTKSKRTRKITNRTGSI